MTGAGADRPALDHVVLLDARGIPAGFEDRHTVHSCVTPLHLGFSCHVVDAQGRVLITRRSVAKKTWPGVWTNACCGHPRLGESLRAAVDRRLRDELGATASSMAVAIPDFAYRAVMSDGTVEHELCPVVVARLDTDPEPDADEVDDLMWVDWDALCERAEARPETLSPWSVSQIRRLAARPLTAWLEAPSQPDVVLDAPASPPRAKGLPTAVPDCDPFAPVRDPLSALLDGFLDDRVTELLTMSADLEPIAREVRSLVEAGGKRLRPAFVCWGAAAAGVVYDETWLPLAGAVELLHTFALLHDDVMDRSEFRRGRPTAWRSFADDHRRMADPDDAHWFGISAAVLAGDLAFVWADQLFDEAKLSRDAAADARRVYDELRVEVMAGQFLDLRSASAAADEEHAQRVALLKSGRYTVTRPLLLGLATMGRRDAALRRALTRYGDAVGQAFQMRDDILDLFGTAENTGKGCGADLRSGKRTVLLLRALALAEPTDRRQLEECLGDPALDDEGLRRCRAIVAGSGALASAEAMLRSSHATAIAALEPVPEPARSALVSLATRAIDRCA